MTDIPPVVIGEEDGNVIGHAQTEIIVALHLLVEGPHLRTFLGGSARLLTDDVALIVDDISEQLDVTLFVGTLLLMTLGDAHSRVAIATHADGDEVLGVASTPHAFAEEAVDDGLIRYVIPRSILTTMAHPLLMVARHRFVVTGTDDDAHLIGCR